MAVSSLERLPFELKLSILRYLNAQDLCRLGSTSHALREASQADEVWRDRVQDIVNAHLTVCAPTSPPWKAQDVAGIYKAYVQGYLSRYARYLGIERRNLVMHR